jgi:hypothetical protein
MYGVQLRIRGLGALLRPSRIKMKFLKVSISICAAIICLCICPKVGMAQSSSAELTPPILDPFDSKIYRPPVAAHPTTLPSAASDPAEADILACACGCGIFEVGTRSMLPMGTGLTLYLEYAYQDQNINWNGTGSASSSANDDKEIRTNFYTPGFQYMFDRNWGVQAELPFASRYFQTTGGKSGSDIVSFDWSTIGDLRLEGIYDGFFPDQSAGVTFGLKLPTGNFKHNDSFDDIDRDSEIGTGSTDILLGGFYRNNLTADGTVAWFAQANLDVPALIQDRYRPGIEADGALGVYLNGMKLGPVAVTPIAQVLDSWRGHDSGANAASPIASGYERVLLSPGLEFDLHPIMIYADIELPVYQHVTGEQLVAADALKIILSYHF